MASSVGLCQRHEPQHSHDVKVSPARQELKGGKGKPHISGGTLRHPRKKKKKEGSDLASYDNNTTNRKADVETKLDRQKKKTKKKKPRVHTYHT